MKKQLLLLISVILPLTVASQLNMEINGGSTLATYKSATDEGIIPEYNILAGFQVGAFTEVVINNYLSLKPGLLFSKRGARSEIIQTFTVPGTTGFTSVSIKMKTTFNPYYLDFPVYLKAAFPSAGSDKFIIGAGPWFSYGIGGKADIKATVESVNATTELRLFSKDKIVLKDNDGNTYPIDESYSTLQKRFDAGLSGFVSYEFNARIILALTYPYGLRNISDDPDEDLWNRCLTISAGYKFK